jgi:hypothetical protein
MKGILEKKEEGWFIRWSDLHSFAHGTHWMWTPLHQTEVVDETKYKDGDEVEFEMVITGYDKEIFNPFSYAKLSKQNKLIMTHQIKTFDDKILVELRIVDYGTEFFTSNELSILSQKITDANNEHGLQFENDLSSLNGIKKEIINNKFTEISEKWGLKYEKLF